MKRPFLPILPFLKRYPFLSYADIFKFERSEILSNLSGAVERVKRVLNGDFKIEDGSLEFICAGCVEKDECSGFEECSYPIRLENYLMKKRETRESILEWKRCMVVVSNLEDHLRRKFVVKMARIFREKLKRECEDFILIVAKDLGLRFKRGADGIHVDFRNYLKGAVRIKSRDWKLVNKDVVKGFVRLTRDEFLRLIEEFIKERLMEKVPIKIYVDIGIERSELPVNFECFPECMKKILADLNDGKNVPHTGRFSIASFLINVGYDIERIVDVFRNAPDFDEEKTRYQVEHIAGMRGKCEKYAVPSCETMKSWGLCIWECDVDHPMKFYRGCMNERRDRCKRTSKHSSNSQDNT